MQNNIQVLEQRMLPHVLFRDNLGYFSMTNPNHNLHHLQQRGFIVKELTCWQSTPLTNRKPLEHQETRVQ